MEGYLDLCFCATMSLLSYRNSKDDLSEFAEGVGNVYSMVATYVSAFVVVLLPIYIYILLYINFDKLGRIFPLLLSFLFLLKIHFRNTQSYTVVHFKLYFITRPRVAVSKLLGLGS